MSPEDPTKTPKAEFPLKTWFKALSEDDRNIIEVDIFNGYDAPPLETTLQTIRDREQGRDTMRMLRDYVEQKNAKTTSTAELKKRAKEIAEYIDQKFEEATAEVE